jgi:glucose-6-phosphate dehydrogenase assembly protein OpcA
MLNWLKRETLVMSATATDSFLEGQGIPVDLPNVENELANLWGPAAEQAGGPELENPHVTRIVLANLVVESFQGQCKSLGPVLETVIAQFPCRAIVVVESADSERQITAEVSALCHLPAPGLPQVCSERIVLRAGPDATALVPGAVRPLLEADLPMVLWWTGDPRRHEALFRDLADECSRLILDLPDPGTGVEAIRLGLDPQLCPFSRDSAWFGLARWRELVAQFFDVSCHIDSAKRIDSVQIEALSPDPKRPPRLALWLAAWLAGQLGWKPHGQPQNEAASAGSTFNAEFEATGQVVKLTISTGPIPTGLPATPRLTGVTITSRGPQGEGVETFRLSRPVPESRAVRVEVHAIGSCSLPSIVEAPELDPARRIAAALESSRVDPPFHKALPICLWLLGSS